MIVEMGNAAPHQCVTDPENPALHGHGPTPAAQAHTAAGEPVAPAVYRWSGSGLTFEGPADGDYGALARDLALHLAQNPDVTRLPDHEAFLGIVRDWPHHSAQPPAWVESDNEALGKTLAAFFGATYGAPADVEDTHHSRFGPPGMGPPLPAVSGGSDGGFPSVPERPSFWRASMESGLWLLAFPVLLLHLAATRLQLKVNAGMDIQSRQMGGDVVGDSGTATTAPTATTFTCDGKAYSVNQWVGHRVFTGAVWAKVISNTATVLTVDQWYTPSAPGGAAAATPAAGAYIIADGDGPAWFMGLTANAAAAAVTDTSLTAEITTAAGGLKRKICPYAHSAGASTYTLTPVFTANGSDTLPVTIAKIGVFCSMVVSDTTSTMLFETLLSTTATLSASGDQLTVTETVTL